MLASAVLAIASHSLGFAFEATSFLIGFAAGVGATRGGRGRTAQLIAVGSAALAYFVGQLTLTVLIAGADFEIGFLPFSLWFLVEYTLTHGDVVFLAVPMLLAWRLARGRSGKSESPPPGRSSGSR